MDAFFLHDIRPLRHLHSISTHSHRSRSVPVQSIFFRFTLNNPKSPVQPGQLHQHGHYPFPVDKDILNLFNNKSATWIPAPNSETQTLKASKSTGHGGFDDDKATVKGTLARIIGSSSSGTAPITFTASASSSKDRRSGLRTSLS